MFIVRLYWADYRFIAREVLWVYDINDQQLVKCAIKDSVQIVLIIRNNLAEMD